MVIWRIITVIYSRQIIITKITVLLNKSDVLGYMSCLVHHIRSFRKVLFCFYLDLDPQISTSKIWLKQIVIFPFNRSVLNKIASSTHLTPIQCALRYKLPLFKRQL